MDGLLPLPVATKTRSSANAGCAHRYVLVPMPWMLFGTDAASGGGSDVQGWGDAGKFLTGMSAVGTIALPTILFHAGKIVGGALACELLSAVVLGAVAIAYLNMSDSNDYMSW